jgi:hypothetical protein
MKLGVAPAAGVEARGVVSTLWGIFAVIDARGMAVGLVAANDKENDVVEATGGTAPVPVEVPAPLAAEVDVPLEVDDVEEELGVEAEVVPDGAWRAW